ncbi:MAG: hypothetical protein HDS11_04610 [Bacteroides sp.]|nr:hypothetical protein [Bacteroides sp.]
MKKTLYIVFNVIALMALLVLGGCSDHDEPEPAVPVTPENPGTGGGEDDNPDDPATARTVMVYMVADNSLGAAGCDEADLAEMQQAVDDGALGESGRLIVYYNRRGTAQGVAPVMLEIRPGERVTLKSYPDEPTVYSTDKERLTEALDDMERLAPAEGYGLVFWSHGTGWIEQAGSRSSEAKRPLMYSFGDDRQHRMKITTMAEALKGRRYEFLYFDCCHMASVEVVYELRHAAPLIAGSGTELPADGTDYRLILPCLFADGEADVEGAAKATFELYNSMSGQARTCTMSVIRTAALDALAQASRDVMAAGALNGRDLKDYQAFMRSNSSLFDMADYYETLLGVDPGPIAAWRAALDDAVAYSNTTPAVFNVLKMRTYCGLGTYIISDPTLSDYMGYHGQAWWKDVVSANPNLN